MRRESTRWVRQANLHFTTAEHAQLHHPAVRPRLWIILDDHSRIIRHVQWCWGERAEDQVHELYQGLLKQALPALLLTDNGFALRGGRRGSDGNVRP